MVFCNHRLADEYEQMLECHNPYFNRWFSAIRIFKSEKTSRGKVTILILIDGFLQ